MVARELAYNIVVGAVRQSGVDQAFAGVNRNIQATQMELTAALDRQRELNAEITRAKRAGESYDALSAELQTTKGRIDELNGSIQQQQERVAENTRRTEQWGRRMRWVTAGAAALSGALLALVHIQGEYSRSVINAAEATGQSAEEIERLDQAARRLTGGALSPDTWAQITDGLRQMQHQFRLGTDLTEEQLIAFRRLGVNPFQTATLGAEDWYNALARVPPQYQAITAAAVPGLSAVYGALRPALERGEAWNEVLADTVALSEETHRRYAETQRRLGDLGRGLRNAGAQAASSLLPTLENSLEALTALTGGFADFIEQNPRLVQVLAAAGIAVTSFTALVWGLNAARAFATALTGVGLPLVAGAAAAAVGVAALGGIAMAGGFGGGGAASATEQQEAAEEKARQQQAASDQANTDRVVNAVNANTILQEAAFERSRQELDPILRAIDCLQEDAARQSEPMVPTGDARDLLTDPSQRETRPTVSMAEPSVPTALPAPLDPAAQAENRDTSIREAYRLSLYSPLSPAEIHQLLLAGQPIPGATPALQPGDPGFHGPLEQAPRIANRDLNVDDDFDRRLLGQSLGFVPPNLSPLQPAANVEPVVIRPEVEQPVINPVVGAANVEPVVRQPEIRLPPVEMPARAPADYAPHAGYGSPEPREVSVVNNFYQSPDPAGEIIRETDAVLTRVGNRK